MYYPDLQEFQKLAAKGNLIPVTRRLLADIETPLSAYRKIRGPAESFLFESVEGGEHLGRYSFVGCNPRAVIRQLSDRVEVLANGKVVESFAIRPAVAVGEPSAEPGAAKIVRDGLAVVEQVMRQYHPVPLAGLPRFTGGAVGFIFGVLLARVLGTSVFGSPASPRLILLPIILGLAAMVAVVGSLIPLRRAARFDPAPILRGE